MLDLLFSVSELNTYVGQLLSADPALHNVRVRGEISGFKRHTSGHLYFSLKDENALVRCVMFRSQAYELDFRPADGMQVILTGYASLYARDGAFQLYAQSLERQGEGELYMRFLKLKSQLEAEGYFDPAHKLTLPFLPSCVGVATSGTGAAIQDILNIVHRRFPSMPMVLAPVRVQGAGAAEEIAKAIGTLNEKAACDVMIVGRGGGSIEDLWAFNEPVVAKAIYDSAIPVISAVGHETDFTIADFVADLRAPTPSAAAELAVPEETACRDAVTEMSRRLRFGLTATITHSRSRIQLLAASRAFIMPAERVAEARVALDRSMERLQAAAMNKIYENRGRLQSATDRIGALNPLSVLTRGYAVISDAKGNTVTHAEALQAGQNVTLHMQDGSAIAEIKSVAAAGSEPKEVRTHGRKSKV